MISKKLNGLNPRIMLLPYPINSIIDDVDGDDESLPLYHVVVNQGGLSLVFLVVREEPVNKDDYEFKVIRATELVVRTMNTDKVKVTNENISYDITIANKHFEKELYPFKLKLLKVNMHSYSFVESYAEGTGFIFENEVIYNELKKRINDVCKKMISNPKINQS